MSTAIVLHAPLQAAPRRPSWHEPLLLSLPYARRLQLEGNDGPGPFASLAGLALALLGAERIAGRPFAPRDFSFPPDGKPALAQGPAFSVSHTASRVACCVTSVAGCGIDIEDCPGAAAVDVVEKLRRWTATEAVLKAMGLGLRAVREVRLDATLDSGSVRDSRFALQPLAALPGVIGHVAFDTYCFVTVDAVELDGAELSAALERSLGLSSQCE
jgi:hypothetical protein